MQVENKLHNTAAEELSRPKRINNRTVKRKTINTKSDCNKNETNNIHSAPLSECLENTDEIQKSKDGFNLVNNNLNSKSRSKKNAKKPKLEKKAELTARSEGDNPDHVNLQMALEDVLFGKQKEFFKSPEVIDILQNLADGPLQ